MLNQIIQRLVMSLFNRGLNAGIRRMGASGKTDAAGKAAPRTEAERLQQRQAQENRKRAQDMAKLTRRMR